MKMSLPRRAFTIVEMMVVIAILMILLALLLPSMGRARSAAKLASCTNNLRMIYTATGGYTTDQARATPPTPLTVPGWQSQILPFLNGDMRVLYCMEDNNPYSVAGSTTGTTGTTGTGTTGTSGSSSTSYPSDTGLKMKVMDGNRNYMYTVQVGVFTMPAPAQFYRNSPTNVAGWRIRTGTTPTPTSFQLEFEDGVDQNWSDIYIQFDLLPTGQTQIKYNGGGAGYSYEIDDSQGNVVPGFSYMCGGGKGTSVVGTTAIITGTTTYSAGGSGSDGSYAAGGASRWLWQADGSYGFNIYAGDPAYRPSLIMALDYASDKADPKNDDWSQWASPTGLGYFWFARHGGRCNVLFGDGSIQQLAAPDINPTNSAAVQTRYWVP